MWLWDIISSSWRINIQYFCRKQNLKVHLDEVHFFHLEVKVHADTADWFE